MAILLFAGCWFQNAKAQLTTEVWPLDRNSLGGEVRIFTVPEDAEEFSSIAKIPPDIGKRVLDGGIVGIKTPEAGHWRTVLVLMEDGTVRGWGSNQTHLLDIPADLSDVIQLTASTYFAAALRSDGEVVTWGSAGDIHARGKFAQLAAGSTHLLALTEDGKIKAFGNNRIGQSNPPRLETVNRVMALGETSLAISTKGELHAWGRQLPGLTPLPEELPAVRQFASRRGVYVTIGADSKVFVWGDPNDNGLKGLLPWNGLISTQVVGGDYRMAMLNPEGHWVILGLGSGPLHDELAKARLVRFRFPHIFAIFGKPVGPASPPDTDPSVTANKSGTEAPKMTIGKDAAPETKVRPPKIPAVEALIASFTKELTQKAGRPHLKSVGELDKLYTGALDRTEKTAISAGNLDLVKAVRREQEILAGDGIPATDEAEILKPILTLREKYRSQLKVYAAERDERAVDLISGLHESLEQLEIGLTKENRIDDASEIRKFRDRLKLWLEAEFGIR